MNTVILITNQDEIKQQLQENLVLLRSTDKLVATNYDNAPDVLYQLRPDIIILHEHETREKTFALIKYLKEKRIFKNSNIILLVNGYDRSFILSAYDEGIDDYLSVNAEPSEILIRVINSIRKSDLNTKIRNLSSDLAIYNVLDSKTGFYNEKFEVDIFSSHLLKDEFKNASYMIVTPDDKGKKEFSSDKWTNAIKKSIRSGDSVCILSSGGYSFLLQTGVDGAVCVYEKIKSELGDGISLKAGISIADTGDFSEIKKRAISSLNKASLQGCEYVIYSTDEKNTDDWLEEPENEEKTYKFFKKALSNKLENVIAPVFYRMQKTYEEKIGEAKIEQFTDETQSVFRIISGQHESRLTMMYPRYSKLVVYITHSGFDSPENREIIIPLNLVNQDKIDKIMESFINEFIGIYRHMYTD